MVFILKACFTISSDDHSSKVADCGSSSSKAFSWDEITKASKNFSKVIGSGGFSTVYLARLGDVLTAVKIQSSCTDRLTRIHDQELQILLTLEHHPNIVNFLGHSSSCDEHALLFEYVSWKQRTMIAFHLAQALEYIHSLHIIHGDIKASNLLLDQHYNSKLCDFGSAKLGFTSMVLPPSSTKTNRMMIMGSQGYVDPHYLKTGLVSKKNDIYSYGVVLLELITGKEAFSMERGDKLTQIIGKVVCVDDVMDPRLIKYDAFDIEEVKGMVKMAGKCKPTSGYRSGRRWLIVDFEKAYDSVRWDFIDDILNKFGFGEKWCHWIQACLCSSRGSVLVNGSPTQEFQFHKGLKQGDPLSPFLFILVMESLYISFQRVVDTGLFNGIKVGASTQLSHLFYADDAIFMRQWNQLNIDTLTHVLEVFHRASGLRINMNKSKLMGILVDPHKVDQAATKIGCMILKMPFKYLGSRVGDPMSRIASRNEVIDSMRIRFSRWKVLRNMESIRARFFNGIDTKSKKLSWVRWRNVMASKNNGGLGLSSLFALNRALLFKWVWRFISQKNLFGLGYCIKVLAPRIYALEMRKDISVESKLSHDGLEFSLRRTPRVVENRKVIDDNTLPKSMSKTRWVKVVPIKVNVHAWKVQTDGLPTRFNLSHRCMEIESIVFPLSEKMVESTRHLFFSYCFVTELMRLISRWWDIEYKEVNSYQDWLEWLVSIRLPVNQKQAFEGICYIVWWYIWSWHNKSIFGQLIPPKMNMFDEVVSRPFFWMRFRSKVNFSWIEWLKNPNLILL
nr:RNA-directed DNA polymerase, eukaryota [Tanacetum cinerariifolium]